MQRLSGYIPVRQMAIKGVRPTCAHIHIGRTSSLPCRSITWSRSTDQNSKRPTDSRLLKQAAPTVRTLDHSFQHISKCQRRNHQRTHIGLVTGSK